MHDVDIEIGPVPPSPTSAPPPHSMHREHPESGGEGVHEADAGESTSQARESL